MSTTNQNVLSALQSRLSENIVQDSVDKIESLEATEVGVQGLLSAIEGRYKKVVSGYSEIYDIFAESIHESLLTTRDSGEYEDFAELAVLYFIRDADRNGFTIKEIESFLHKL